MEYFAGIDVSLEQSSVCVADGTGKIVREAKLASEPEAPGRVLPWAGDWSESDRAGSGTFVAMAICWPGHGRV